MVLSILLNFYDKYIRNNYNPLVIKRVIFDEDDLNKLQAKVKLRYSHYPFYNKLSVTKYSIVVLFVDYSELFFREVDLCKANLTIKITNLSISFL